MERAEKARVKRKAKVRESQVESDGKARVKAAGGFSTKFKSPGARSRPDQIEWYGIEPMRKEIEYKTGCFLSARQVREILASAIQLTEYKAPKKEPSEAQLREHDRFRALGFTVNVIDQRTTKETK